MLRLKDIRAAFATYNRTLFGGRLTEPRFAVRKMRDLGCWHEPGPKYPTGLLVLASGQKHPMSWRATLVHELLHIAVPDYEADDHGPLFLAEANKVGKLLGLDECEPCDAWVWPSHNGSWEPPPDANILD